MVDCILESNLYKSNNNSEINIYFKMFRFQSSYYHGYIKGNYIYLVNCSKINNNIKIITECPKMN